MRCFKPIEIYPPASRAQIVPCGKCLPCLQNKRQDWTFRLIQEYKASRGALFVTLTYHPKYLPYQLQKKHVQLFLKRLRKREQNQIRYYLVGEYGEQTKRPHYHILLFNCDLTGNTIRKTWTYGQVHIGTVTEASISYCTKYIIQRHEKINRYKTFTLMSRAYGIGLAYLTDKMAEWHRSGGKNYAMHYDQKVRLPRYYKDKIWYHQLDRQKIMHKAKWEGIRVQRQNNRFFIQEYGIDQAEAKQKEFRLAMLSNMKEKMQYSQTL